MSIIHAFTSAVADEGTAGEVSPNEWNAAHTIDDDTITSAMIGAVLDETNLLGGFAADLAVGHIPCVRILNNGSGATPADTAHGAAGNIHMASALWVTQVWAWKTGANGSAAQTVQLLHEVGGVQHAVTEALDINVAVGTIVRASLLDPAYTSFAAGDYMGLRRTYTSGDSACYVFVVGVPA